MPKIPTLKPRLKTLQSRFSSSSPQNRQEAEAERFRQRDKEQPWRRWYFSSRWQRMRKKIWLRDGYVCQQTGVLCIGEYPEDNSPVADHKIPHHGDETLFWDENNIQTVSKAYHDKQKQAEERARRLRPL